MMTKIKILTLLFAFVSLLSCDSDQRNPSFTPEVGMYKVSILYPNEEGKTFDLDYYEQKHMPMVTGFLGDNLKFYEIDKGISGRTPSDKLPYVAIGTFYCSDVDAYNKAIGQNIDAVLSDIKNYTSIQPIIQISEIKEWK